MIKVFIADDHEIVRRGTRQVLEEIGGFTVVGEASNGRQVLDAKDIGTWDVLLLDLSLPRVNGPEVLRRVKAKRPELPVVVLSMYPEDQYAPQILAAGAHAYLAKDRGAAELIAAVRAAAEGRRYVTPNVAARVENDSAPPHFALTSRENQVFLLLIQGQGMADIAAELDLHASTVSNHVARIREKLGAKSLADIILYAHREGLVAKPFDPPEP